MAEHERRKGLLDKSYPSGTIAFVGSHLDVVPANPDIWERNPFKLVVEGDKLYGRGTTDCLGHVTLITELFIQLAQNKPKLKHSIVAVFIAAEESAAVPGVGVDKLAEMGKLDHLKSGPVFWVDSADSNPRIGTASAAMWKLRTEGHLFHSGLPHKGINSLELSMEAMAFLQRKFYKDFPPHPKEEVYKFATPSTMKPTQVSCAPGSVNQLPPWTEIQGDIRLTPFNDINACVEKLKGYVQELNQDLSVLPTHGPCSKYEIDTPEGKVRGRLEFTIIGHVLKGIAANLDSPAFKHLHDSTAEVLGESKPFSLTGAMPLVGDLQQAGFDIQLCGYGHSGVYHGDNEYCSLSHMENGFKILCRLISKYNNQ